MNQLILDPTTQIVAGPADVSAAGVKSASADLDPEPFRTLLASSLADQPRVGTPTPASAQTASLTGADQTLPALAAKIAKLIEGGASQADVIASLSKQLASSVAGALGSSETDARDKLQAMFAAALAPPGAEDGSSGPVADRAADLARHFIRLKTVADALTGPQLGQQKRIAGNLLDAQRAKEIPARATTSTGTLPIATSQQNVGLVRSSKAAAHALASAAGADNATANNGTASVAGASDTTASGAGARDTTASNAAASANAATAAAAAAATAVSVATAVVAKPTGSRGLFQSPSGRNVPAETSTAGVEATAVSTAIHSGDANGSSIRYDATQGQVSQVGSRKATPSGVSVRAGDLSAHSSDTDATVVAAQAAKRSAKPVPANGTSAAVTSADKISETAANVAGGSTTGAPSTAASTQATPTGTASGLPAPGSVSSAPDATVGLPLNTASLLPASDGGDGRTVNLGSTAATQTGGDTALGRMLTRAALSAAARQPVAGDASAASDASPVAAAKAAAPDTAVSVFVKAFEVALKAATPVDTVKILHEAQPSVALLLPAHGAENSGPVFAPAVAPFVIDRVNAAAVAPPATPVDHSAIADQVLRGAFMRNTGESSEMRLTLVPNGLGDVTVKLVVNAGTVTAHVLAETSGVRDALVAAQPQLSKSLADSGLKLTSFTVDLQGGGFAGFSQQQNQSQNGNRSRHATNVADLDGGDDATLEAIPTFGPSSLTQSNAGYYNYLA